MVVKSQWVVWVEIAMSRTPTPPGEEDTMTNPRKYAIHAGLREAFSWLPRPDALKSTAAKWPGLAIRNHHERSRHE